jgi:hypothetical protein
LGLDIFPAQAYDFCMPKPLRLPVADEQALLDGLKVRLIEPEEKSRWDELIIEHHYLKNAILVGEQLHYLAHYQDQWLALLGWSAPALHLKAREAWLGWSLAQLRSRRHFLAQNSRFLLLGDRLQFPNLATRALGLCCQRLSQDWLQVHGHPILALESFVDSQLFRGTAYKAAGWTMLGPTSGFGRCAEDFYQRHDRPKQLWVRALDSQAVAVLKAESLPPSLAAYEREAAPRCQVSAQKLPSLLDRLPQVADPRRSRGRWHPWPAVLGIICLAKLAGVPGSQDDIAAFAKRLTQAQRRHLGCRRNPPTQVREVPARSTFFRALKAVKYSCLEKTLLDWQNDLLGPEDPKELVVLDGKALHGAQGQMVINAISVPSGRVHGVEPVHRAEEPLSAQDCPLSSASTGAENEIPAVRRLLSRTELAGRLVSLDAMHTQHQTAAQIVLEAGADFLLTLKDNQSTLLKTAQSLVPGDFFPSGNLSAASTDGPDRGKESGPDRDSPPGDA